MRHLSLTGVRAGRQSADQLDVVLPAGRSVRRPAPPAEDDLLLLARADAPAEQRSWRILDLDDLVLSEVRELRVRDRREVNAREVFERFSRGDDSRDRDSGGAGSTSPGRTWRHAATSAR